VQVRQQFREGLHLQVLLPLLDHLFQLLVEVVVDLGVVPLALLVDLVVEVLILVVLVEQEHLGKDLLGEIQVLLHQFIVLVEVAVLVEQVFLVFPEVNWVMVDWVFRFHQHFKIQHHNLDQMVEV
jgi:hypothetical protein